MSDTFVGSVRKEDTIYRNGVVPDKSFQIDINFAKMESVSGTSSIFHVSYYGKPRVLKVFRNKTDPGHADDHIRDLDRSRCEIRAYCTLKRSKLCDAGVVPNFYGFMLAVDPANCAHLDAFRHDKGDAATIIDNYRSDTAFHCAHSCQLAPIDRDVCPCGVRLMASDGMSGAQDTI